MFGELTGVSFGTERMHTLTNELATDLTVLDVAPSPEEGTRQVRALRKGHRRPLLV